MVVISCPAAIEMRSGICTKHTTMEGVGWGWGRKEVQIVHTKDVCMHIGVE